MVGNAEVYAAFGATAGENLAPVLGGHSQAEAMLVDSSSAGGLICSFHCIEILNLQI